MAVVTALPDGRIDGVMTPQQVIDTSAARMRRFDQVKAAVKRTWGKAMGFVRSVGRWTKTRARRIYDWITGKAVTPTAQWFARNAKRVGTWVKNAASGAWHWSASARAWVATPLRVAGSVTASMFTLMLIGSRMLLIAIPITAFLLVKGAYNAMDESEKTTDETVTENGQVVSKTVTTRTVRKGRGKTSPKSTTTTPTKKVVTKPVAKKAAPAKKAAAKRPASKAPANRPAAKKAPAKKAVARKAPAKRAAAPKVETPTVIEETTTTTVVEEKVVPAANPKTGWNQAQELAVVNRIHHLNDVWDTHTDSGNKPMASAYAGRVYLATVRHDGNTEDPQNVFSVYQAEQVAHGGENSFDFPMVRKGVFEEDRHLTRLLAKHAEPELVTV